MAISEFEKRVCRISCGNLCGTAFLLSPELVITATHCIEGFDTRTTPINLEFRNLSTKPMCVDAVPLTPMEEHTLPVVLLKISKPIESIAVSPPFIKTLKPMIGIKIFGYPSYAHSDGVWIEGEISRVITRKQVQSSDWNIRITPNDKALDYHECSGSPLICDDRFVGIILAQESQNGTAVLIDAVDNSLIQDYLTKNDIICEIDSKSVVSYNSDTVASDSMLTGMVTPGTNISIEKLDADINKLLRDKLLNIIRACIVGDDNNGIKKLLEIVNSIEYQSDKHYWQFFYQAAVWLNDKQDKQAEKYYTIAKKLNPTIDDRLYRASQLVNSANFDLAEQILSPINTTAVLGELLILKYKQGCGSEADNILLSAKIVPDETVNNALALCYLQTRKFDMAIETTKKLTDTYPNSILYWYLTGLIYYWKAISNYTDLIPCDHLFLFKRKTVLLSDNNLKDVSIALDCFQKALNLCMMHSNEIWEGILLSACLLSKWVLGHKDTESFYSNVLTRDPANAVAVFYANEHDIQLPDTCINTLSNVTSSPEGSGFEAAVYIDYLINQNNIVKANEEFSRLSMQIKKYSYYIYFEFLFLLPAKSGNMRKAKQIIETSQMPIIEKKRARLYLAQYDKKASQKTTINTANYLLKNSGKVIDYHNLYVCYCKYKMWDKAIDVAKEWNKKYSEPQAIINIAEAYYQKKKYEKALEYYDQFEAFCALDHNLKRKKLSCLSHQSKFAESLILIKEIGLDKNDESLFIEKAKIEHVNGKNQQAISTLYSFLELKPGNINATMFLVKLLLAENKEEAFQQMKSLYELYPDNINIGMEAMHIGFNTGHDDIASLWMRDILSKDPEQKHMKCLSIEEIMEFIDTQKNESKREENHQMLSEGKIPIHIYLDAQNGSSISKMYYGHLIEKDKYFFPLCFGSRPDFSQAEVPEYKIIAMDYTAFLTAHALGLLSKLQGCFENIMVSPSLFPFITQEIAQLSNYQESRPQKDQQLLQFIKTNNINLIPNASIPDNHLIAEPNDLIEYYSALENNCILVTDSFSTEMLKKSLPKELYSIRVFGADIWEILCLRREVDSRTFQQASNPENLKKLNGKVKLLIDKIILEEFQQYLDLKILLKYFDIYIMEQDFEILQESVAQCEKQERCLSWLRKLSAEIKTLIQAGFIKFSPTSDKHVENCTLSNMLVDLLNYITTSSIPIWVDDRCFNSYSSTSSSPTLGIFDMLWYLLKKDIITQNEYCAKVSELFSSNLSFHVPNYMYITNCLLSSSINGDGALIETDALTNLKRSISRALYSNSSIGRAPLTHIPVPENLGYIKNLTDSFICTLRLIWSIDQVDVDSKIAMSNWLLINMSDYTCDVDFLPNENICRYISSKHWYLITNLFTISEPFKLFYCEWIFYYLYLYWEINPKDKLSTAHSIAKFCVELKDGTFEKTQTYLLESFKKYMPTDFFNLICMDKLFEGKQQHLFVEEDPNDLIAESEEAEAVSDKLQKQIQSLDYIDPVAGFIAQPEQWHLYFALISAIADDKSPLIAIINFTNEVLDKSSGNDILPAKCKEHIAMMVWRSKPEERVAIQELRRRLTVT